MKKYKRRVATKRKKIDLEGMLFDQIKLAGLVAPDRQVKIFANAVELGAGIRARLKEAGFQNWVFDFVFEKEKLAVEVQGGTWIGGAHNRGAHMKSDYRKMNNAQKLGYRVLYFDTGMVRNGEAVAMLANFLPPRNFKKP